jgi:hypothetical protein
MKLRLTTTLLLVVGLAVAALSISATTTTRPARAADTGTWPIDTYGAPRATDNAILRWDEQLLSAIRAYPPQTGPTITARALGVLHTATYDAWAAYDPTAKVTRPDGPAQQKSTLNNTANKTKAISYAAYRAMLDLFPPSAFPAKGNYKTPDVLLSSQGYDPNYSTVASTTDTAADPAAVGNRAAQAVVNYRHNDGSNQLGNDPQGTAGVRYSDTTGYTPANDWNKVNNRWRWQPLCVPTPPPGATTCSGSVQKATTPQWGKVLTFSPTPVTSYRVTGPPKNPDGSYATNDIATALADTSNLTDVEKAKAEYWADGPLSEFPPGHTALFAQAISRKKGNSLDSDAKLFFMVGNAMMDASIASWYLKFRYDFVRPITGIREQYKGQMINSWLGANADQTVNGGYGTVPGEQWIPFQAPNVVTPPFPEYVSGHSTFTSAGAQILAMFNGDTFGATVTIPAGSSKFTNNTPATTVTLSFPTFTEAATDAGMSRRWGGIHFQTGDYHGRTVGKQVANGVYSQAMNYIRGYIGK